MTAESRPRPRSSAYKSRDAHRGESCCFLFSSIPASCTVRSHFFLLISAERTSRRRLLAHQIFTYPIIPTVLCSRDIVFSLSTISLPGNLYLTHLSLSGLAVRNPSALVAARNYDTDVDRQHGIRGCFEGPRLLGQGCRRVGARIDHGSVDADERGFEAWYEPRTHSPRPAPANPSLQLSLRAGNGVPGISSASGSPTPSTSTPG